jgi:hypothetical protein
MAGSEPPYRELQPDEWRRLLARGAVFHAIRARLGRLCEMAHDAAVEAALSRLDEAVRECAGSAADDRAMVAAVVRRWVRAVGRIRARQDPGAEAAILLAELRKLARGASAEDPFAALFARVEAMASDLYGAAWRPATLTVAHLRKHPRGSDRSRDPYAVTALTPWPPEPPPAQIELLIYDDGFGPAAYAAIPILLIHECVCHVAAGQEKAKNDSQFAEGFLDWVGHHFLRIWAARLDPLSATATEEHAQRLGRMPFHGDTPRERMARSLGKQAAGDLLSWFQSECQMRRDEGCHRVAALAVELNRAKRPIADKDHFVSLLRLPFPPAVARKLRAWNEGLATPEELLDLGLPA